MDKFTHNRYPLAKDEENAIKNLNFVIKIGS